MEQTLNDRSPELGDLLFSEEPAGAEPTSFAVDTIDKATWAAHKVVAAEKRIVERAIIADRFKAKIDEWLTRANREDEDSSSFLRSHLKFYAEREVNKQHHSRSLILPGVTIGFRKRPDKLEVLDEVAVLAFCEKNYPAAVCITKSVSKSEVKKLIAKGVSFPAIEITPGTDDFYVTGDEKASMGQEKGNAAA